MITTHKAANVSVRRNGCANNPVEPAAIQAAARPAITAITGPGAADASTGQLVVDFSNFLCLFLTTQWIIPHIIPYATRKTCVPDERLSELTFRLSPFSEDTLLYFSEH
jgi:hypothetical protein